MDADTKADEHRERPVYASSEHTEQTSSERQLTSTYRDLVDILREQLQAAQERERAQQEHIAHLTTMLEQAHQQNQRLLDMPRPAPPPRPSPEQQPVISRTVAPAGDPRGEMRRRIVALLQEHPEGLTTGEMRTLLGVDRSLADTCLGMLKYGLVQRVGRGRYVATEPSRHD